MKKQKNYEKGITLIALVITIIVLLILAGVTLRIVMNGGIINKSQTAVDKYTEESAREKLSVAVVSYKMGVITGEAGTGEKQKTLNDYVSEIDGQLSEAEDSKYYEVELDGYLFWVDKETLEIISKGPSNPTPPTEIRFSSDNTNKAYIGEEKTFKLELTPPNASKKFLKWSVDNEEIATIKNGVLTGKQEGTVIVTVTSTEDATVTASCTVTIKPIELTKITLNKKETTIGMGKTEKLEVIYEPKNATYKDITWSTNNNTIATVENGTITGIKAGTATITATSTSTKNTNIKAECNITVEEIIEISTVEELKAFRDDVNNGTSYVGKKVVLVNDLDLNPGEYTVASDGTVTFNEDAEQWTPIGTETIPFSGSFDGQGHTISGLYINKPTEMYQGLFGYVSGGVLGQSTSYIQNLILKNINIQSGSTSGGICAFVSRTDINKCAVYGNLTCYVSTKENSVFTSRNGGIIGVAGNANISNCYNFATINVGENNKKNFVYIGGILGNLNSNTIVKNCYNFGILNGTQRTGGIVGSSSSSKNNEIKNCYNLGILNGTLNSCGGILSNLRYNIKIDNCYNTGILNGTSTYKGGIIGYIVNDSTNDITINRCSYLTGTATAGIGYTADSSLSIEPSNDLPSVLSVINGDNAFTTDSEGNIVLKFEN